MWHIAKSTGKYIVAVLFPANLCNVAGSKRASLVLEETKSFASDDNNCALLQPSFLGTIVSLYLVPITKRRKELFNFLCAT